MDVGRCGQDLGHHASGGHLTVSGCGLSTQIVASTEERAIVLQKWDSASVSDLSAATKVAKPPTGNEYRHFGGALTFLACRSASVERVIAACGTGDRRAATCVTIRNDEQRPGDARVRGCEFLVGAHQTAVLLVNVDRVTVDDNRGTVNLGLLRLGHFGAGAQR